MAASVEASGAPGRTRHPFRMRLPRTSREAGVALLFLAPNLIGFLILTLGPGLFSLIMGFTNWSGISRAKWVGIDNYAELMADTVFLTALRNTLVYTLEFTPLVIGASLLFALLFNQKLLGVPVIRALNTVNTSLGFESGFVIVVVAIMLDRMLRVRQK